MSADAPREALAAALEREWYHTIELAPEVVTPGWFDTRGIVDELPFPATLKGKRCLDVATFDGFWAFEMERRGAAEVHAIHVLGPHSWDWRVTQRDDPGAPIGRRQEDGRGYRL